MANYFAIDAIYEAFNKTKAFFKGDGLLKKWLKLALLVWVVNLLSGGGGGGGNISRRLDKEELPQISQLLSQIDWGFVILVVLIILVIIFIISILLSILRNACFFSILESISLNAVSIRAYLRKFLGLAVSLTILEIIFCILSLPIFLCWLIVIFGVIIMFFPIAGDFLITASSSNSFVVSTIQFVANPIVVGIAFIIGIIGAILFTIIYYVLGQFGAYIMYKENKKAWESFKKALMLVRQNLIQVGVLILVQIGFTALLIGLGIIIFLILIIPTIIYIIVIVGLIAGAAMISPFLIIPIILLALVVTLILSYIGTAFFLPIDVFFYYFNLTFIEKMLGTATPAKETITRKKFK